MLDIKRLQYLEAVYRHRNFTRASEEMFVSQPAISFAIRSLEQEFGVRLIQRDSKNVIFTVEGEQFMALASRILKECGEAENLLSSFSQNSKQTLLLGLSPTLSGPLLARLYADFFPQWPNADIRINEAPQMLHLSMIRSGQLDLSYNALPDEPDNDLISIPLTETEVGILLRRDHPLALCERIPCRLLYKEPLAMLGDNSRINAIVRREFHKQGLVPNTRSVHDQISCMIHIVQQAGQVAFINYDEYFTSLNQSDLVFRSFEEPLYIKTGLFYKRSHHPSQIMRELIAFITALKPEDFRFHK